MDNTNYAELRAHAKELNRLGIQERKNGNYAMAADLFTQAINTYPAEPYFFNRSLATLATIQRFSESSYASDDMFVALLMAYVNQARSLDQNMIIQMIMYYLTKMMQINLLNENILLKDQEQKQLYRIHILADKYADYSNYIAQTNNEYEKQVFAWFDSENFSNEFNSYMAQYAVGPFRMELSDNVRDKWLAQSKNDVAVCLKAPALKEAAQEIYNILFK